jgi:hypothetical protein
MDAQSSEPKATRIITSGNGLLSNHEVQVGNEDGNHEQKASGNGIHGG